MTRHQRWAPRLACLAVAAAAVLVVGCPASAPPPAAPAEPSPAMTSELPPETPQPMVEPVEAGFVHCCGTDSYRMEISCSEMTKRCYESSSGSWKQTYGRHCRNALGSDCYLAECDAKCQ